MIEVYGIDRELTIKAIYSYCRQLDVDVPSILIYVDDDLKDPHKEYACVHSNGDEFMIRIAPVSKFLNVTQMYETLAHEMVHVKQFLKNNLEEHLENTDIPYSLRWWEIEAYELEKKLVINFTQEIIDERTNSK